MMGADIFSFTSAKGTVFNRHRIYTFILGYITTRYNHVPSWYIEERDSTVITKDILCNNPLII